MLIVIFAMTGLFRPAQLNAAPEVTFVGSPKVGWDGHYVVGKWTPVVVPVKITGGGALDPLHLTAADSDGNRVEFVSDSLETIRDDEYRYSGVLKVGRLDSEISIQLGNGPVLRGIPGRTEWLAKPLKPSTRLIVTVGDPNGFDFATESSKASAGIKIAKMKPHEMSSISQAYDSVLAVVISGTPQLSVMQVRSIEDWVVHGGRLVISVPQDVTAAQQAIQPFEKWLPVSIGNEPVTVREFGALEAFSGKNQRIPQKTTLSIPSLRINSGEILAASRSDAFLVQAPYGLGTVTVLAMDLNASPLSEWTALPHFCARLVGLRSSSEGGEKNASKGSQLSSTGITDLATQLNSTQENFERIQRVSPWLSMGLLLVLLAVIGPVDYLLVHRVLKKPHVTWISFPCLAAICGLVTSWMANSTNGAQRRVNQLSIVDVDVATSQAFEKHFVTPYSPATVQSSVEVRPQGLIKTNDLISVSSAHLIWQGVPEPTFGGMLREASLDQGANYQRLRDGTLAQLPLMQWSSKALLAENTQPVSGLIECDLQASPTGRLSGTITHHFPVPIEDWMLVYKSVVYRFLKVKDDSQTLPLPADQVWRVDQPRVFTREIRPFLTGVTTMATPKFGQSAPKEASNRLSNYDPLSLDPAGVVRTLTFHEEIGGERYTGLTNQLLGSEDLSHLLRLGRAVLFGRIRVTTAKVYWDRAPIEADRETSFVRIILPVKRSTEVIKVLPKFEQ